MSRRQASTWGGRKRAGPALLIAALGAIATEAHGARDPWQEYRSAIARQCPAKHLERLSPADLRDALDAYEALQPPAARRLLSHTRAARCRAVPAGASCDNAGDFAEAARMGTLPALAASVCGRFAGCRGPAECAVAR